MKFSIVTPTRNSLDKLKRCVGSVRGQKGVMFEHIVQDACSEDGTPEWLSVQADLNWRSENDGGMYDAINRGWRRASGDILCWLNSDEQYLPGTLERVKNTFSRNPDIDFVFGNYIVISNTGNPIAARREIRLSKSYIANGFLNAASCTMFFRSRILADLELDLKYRYASDMDLVLRLLDNNRKAKKIDEYLSLFTFDGSNLSCSPTMITETREIRKKFGGSSSFTSLPYRFGRVLEKLMAGCYMRDNISYDYAIDSTPNYITFNAKGVSQAYITQ
ncbi:MAG: glycosyltransferase family 2 protein [Pseudomonadota bacterium]